MVQINAFTIEQGFSKWGPGPGDKGVIGCLLDIFMKNGVKM